MATQLKNNLFQFGYLFSAVCSFCYSANKSRIDNFNGRPYTVAPFQKKNSTPLAAARSLTDEVRLPRKQGSRRSAKTGKGPKHLFQASPTGLIKKQPKTKKPSNKVAAALPKNTNLFCLISINRTKNNTHAVISNLFGENKTKWSISAGQLKLPGGRRKTRLSQRMIYKSCLEKALSFGYRFTVIHCRGTRGSKVRIFRFFGDYLSVLLIKDITGAAHNGCRPPKVRRV